MSKTVLKLKLGEIDMLKRENRRLSFNWFVMLAAASLSILANIILITGGE